MNKLVTSLKKGATSYNDKARGIQRDLHGSAGFGDLNDIKKMSLLNNDGVYVGGYCDDKGVHHYLRHNGPEHVMAFAPTRSGKGVGLVVPTLLSWMQSVVVFDIKGENWSLTAGWRQQYANNVCLKFEPSAERGSCHYNPLSEIRYGSSHATKDVQNLTLMIVDPDGKGLNDHWAKTGHAFLTGVILYAFELTAKKHETPNLRLVSEMISDPNKTSEELFNDMLTSTNRVVAGCAREMLNKAANERSGVISTAASFLSLYKDDIVAENTKDSDFKISDLMHHDNPVSLYIVVPPTELDRLKPLLRLLLNQIVRGLCDKIEFENGRQKKTYKHRLLLLIDEFPALGKMEILETSLAFIAGYGIKAFLITQDLSQLRKHYGKDESITSNCHVSIAYAPNKVETAQEVSKMCGVATVQKRQVSFSGGLGLFSKRNKSVSYQEVKRELMTPDEVMALKGIQTDDRGNCVDSGEMLIFMAGKKPIKGNQILYFTDDVFQKRCAITAPFKSGQIERRSHV